MDVGKNMNNSRPAKDYFMEKSGLFLVLAILAIAALVIKGLTGVNFYMPANLLNILRSFSILGIAALGQTVVIIAGGLDLSVGEVISASNILAAHYTDSCLILGKRLAEMVTGQSSDPSHQTLEEI